MILKMQALYVIFVELAKLLHVKAKVHYTDNSIDTGKGDDYEQR